jgi:hypothetical protein
MAEAQISLAYHVYDINDSFRSKLLLELLADLDAKRYTKTCKRNWDTNVVLDMREIEDKLKNAFTVVHTEYHALHTPQLTYVLKSQTIAHSYAIDLSIKEELAEYTIYGNDFQAITHAEEALLSNFQLYQPKATSNKVCSFRFHHKSPDGIDSRVQALDAVSLVDIRHNYTPDVFEQIEKLASLEDPYKFGKIILYHGAAGNGKTHLIRALAYEWSKKFDVQPEVVIDPEPLFEQPGYLMELLATPDFLNKTPKFRFIIAEDCANLFGVRCRDNAGFTRLLNVVDGLLGAGQKLVFLFTANEEINEIDPAILRPGRCLQHLQITNWDRSAAEGWLTRQGAPDKIARLSATNSLADLYAILNNVDIFTNKKEMFGF